MAERLPCVPLQNGVTVQGDYLLRAVLMGAVLCRAGRCGAAEPWGDLTRVGWLLPSASRGDGE